jgi:hypothetical protein
MPYCYYFATLFYNMPLGKGQENQDGLEVNGTHQILVYADNSNLLGKNINTINKKTEALSDARKEVD